MKSLYVMIDQVETSQPKAINQDAGIPQAESKTVSYSHVAELSK